MCIAVHMTVAACGDNLIDPPDGTTTPPFTTAPHVPLPTVLRHQGTVIANLRLVTMVFDGYDASAVQRFGDAVVVSDWYDTVAEYGIHPGSHQPTVTIGPAPSGLTRDSIAALIKQQLVDNRVPRPSANNTQLLYMIYVPSSAVAPELDGVTGYHHMATLDGVPFPIAVVIDDGRGPAAMTSTAGRQLVNAVTNPYEPPNDGYYVHPTMYDPWSLGLPREVGDLCDSQGTVVEGDLTLPHVYSDKEAKLGRPPCMPSSPDDTWSDVSADPSDIRTHARGSMVTFVLRGWSTQEMPPWELRTRVAEYSDLSEDEMQPVLSDNLIENNKTVKLTLRVPLTALSGALGGVYVLSGANGNPWPVGFVVR